MTMIENFGEMIFDNGVENLRHSVSAECRMPIESLDALVISNILELFFGGYKFYITISTL